jgi:hypothetical protein
MTDFFVWLQTHDLTTEDAYVKLFIVDDQTCKVDIIDIAGQG